MSVNINFSLSVTRLPGPEQVDAVLTALEAVMLDHGIDGEVVLGVHPGEAGEHQVVGDNGSYPLCITRCYPWRPRFESDVELAVGRAAPSAKVVIDWDYPDERH